MLIAFVAGVCTGAVILWVMRGILNCAVDDVFYPFCSPDGVTAKEVAHNIAEFACYVDEVKNNSNMSEHAMRLEELHGIAHEVADEICPLRRRFCDE